MSAPESPQLQRDRVSRVVVASLVALAAPLVALLVSEAAGDEAARQTALVWLAASALVGAAIPFLYWAPYRALGFVTYGTLWWIAATAHGAYWHEWPGWANGFPLGLIVGAPRGDDAADDDWRMAFRSLRQFLLARAWRGVFDPSNR